MADAKFSFQEKGRIYYPAWMSPDGNTFMYHFYKFVLFIVYIRMNLME